MSLQSSLSDPIFANMEPKEKCENDVGPGCMGTPTALLHMELVGSQEYLPGSEGKYLCHRSEETKQGGIDQSMKQQLNRCTALMCKNIFVCGSE